MSDLTVSLIQTDIAPDDPEANLAAYAGTVQTLPATDLVVLPEVMTTGFHPMARQHAESPGGRAYQWMRAQAAERDAVVTGSMVLAEGERHTNRLVWARPDGSFSHYDKRHLFRMAGEHKRYAPGTERPVWQIGEWRVLPQVCYDLRFPVFSRNRDDYDLAVYVANWPAARRQHWRALLVARAIENLSYVIGVNRVGQDAYGQHYSGDSLIVSPTGEILLDALDEPGAYTRTLSLELLRDYRKSFPAHLDADAFTLSDDG